MRELLHGFVDFVCELPMSFWIAIVCAVIAKKYLSWILRDSILRPVPKVIVKLEEAEEKDVICRKKFDPDTLGKNKSDLFI